MTKLAFIGFGRMGSALAAGAISSKVLTASRVVVFDVDADCLKRAKKLKVKTAKSEAGAVEQSDLIFLCVKPQQMEAALNAIRPALAKAKKGKCFVSIAAGVTLDRLEKSLGDGTPVLRVMPNTPALLKAGMSVLSRGKHATPAHEKTVRAILGSVGEVISLPERLMDAVTAVSGSGPAYVFYLAEGMIAAAQEQGIDEASARTLVRQTIFGSGLMLRERNEPAAELRRQVTSPGGTTAAAIAEFESRDFLGSIKNALSKAARRSKELSQL